MTNSIEPSPSCDIFEPAAVQLDTDSDSLAEVMQRAQDAFRESTRPSILTTSGQTDSTLSAISVLSATSDEIILRFHHHAAPADSTPSFPTAPGPPVTALQLAQTESTTKYLMMHLPSPSHPAPGLAPTPINPLLQAYASLAAKFDPGAALGQLGERMEKTFWAMVIPTIQGLTGGGQSFSTAFTSFASATRAPAISTTESADASEGRVKEHLYSHETIYTLRLPQHTLDALRTAGDTARGEREKIDLGPTLQPIWVRKRAALPDWDENATQRVPWEAGWRHAGSGAGRW